MVGEGLVDSWTPMRCGIGCWVAAFSLPECFVPRVWEGARHCCRLEERKGSWVYLPDTRNIFNGEHSIVSIQQTSLSLHV